MKAPGLTFRQWVGWTGLVAVFVLVAAVAVWRGDILRAGLDPQQPFQTYTPPDAPDYSQPSSWALSEARASDAGATPVFFVHPTTFDGQREWNGPIGDRQADAFLTRVALPNYAGPFARTGPVSAPRYRQGSLYTRLTLRDDARDARAFAYRDVAAALDVWLARHPDGPLVLVGVEQGGELLDRLLRERLAADPALARRLVAVYLIDVILAANGTPLPPCATARQTGCLIAWAGVQTGDESSAQRRLRRALVWDGRGRLVDLGGRPALCVNPVTGATQAPVSQARASRGATNATGLEWGVQPGLRAREVAAECRDGILFHTRPASEAFNGSGSWVDRRKARPYNLFYGDIQADVEQRARAWSPPG